MFCPLSPFLKLCGKFQIRDLLIISLLLLALLFLASCDFEDESLYSPQFSKTSPSAQFEYSFAVHPLHNPQRLFAVFGPLIEYLSEHIPEASFKLEASRNYAAFDKKLYSGKVHFALPNPFQTVKSLAKGYRVFAKMGDDHNFCGIILIRKDSAIETVADLKGRAVSYPAPTALAATMMPQYYLQTHGVDVMTELDNRYVGSQESSIMNVFLGETAAGATWPPPWIALAKERPELALELEIKWQTASLPNNGLVVRSDVSEEIVNRVKSLLIGLDQHPAGRKILARMELSAFVAADNATYQPVRDFIKRFSATVRPLS